MYFVLPNSALDVILTRPRYEYFKQEILILFLLLHVSQQSLFLIRVVMFYDILSVLHVHLFKVISERFQSHISEYALMILK